MRNWVLVMDLLDSLETNFITGIITEYTDLMGPVFWVVVSLILMLPLQNRIGLLPIALIALQIWGMLVFVLPAGALNVGMAIIILAGSSMLTILLFARRRQYG